MGYLIVETYLLRFFGFMAVFKAMGCFGYTDPRDVYAINSLYTAVGNPPLPRWSTMFGDPCGDAWKGVECVFANITAIKLNGENLGGDLGTNLQLFTSIITLDLSNNHIGGSIPSNLPFTIQNFSLSSNKLTGRIPSTLSSLGQLTYMDLSVNNLSGQLPQSMSNLPFLTSLHLQNNQLSGTLDILQDLPLVDLDVENNLFSGPIPDKLLNIPNFRKGGNPFNTSIISPPPASPPQSSHSVAPASEAAPSINAYGPFPGDRSISDVTKKNLATKKFIWILITGFTILVVSSLGLCVFILWCCNGRPEDNRSTKKNDKLGLVDVPREKVTRKKSSLTKSSPRENEEEMSPKTLQGEHVMDCGRFVLNVKSQVKEIDIKEMPKDSKHEDNMTKMKERDAILMSPLPPRPTSILPGQEFVVKPTVPVEITAGKGFSQNLNAESSGLSFTFAALQQFTNSFCQEKQMGGGMHGSVYRAELPSGKILAVKKLDTAASEMLNDDKFLELVSILSKFNHPNIVKLVGYCYEHRQRLLVYDYHSNWTLHDALHLDDKTHRKLSWNARMRIALGAARALEFLHEVCQPQIVHQNFMSVNLLIDDELGVHVADCGLSPLLASSNIDQSSNQLLCACGYGAPECELGSYNYHSDVYSFGVVVLELLTGRKPFDRSRPRGEQLLVGWAVPQLHDIDALSGMVDPFLNGYYPPKSLSRLADIISLCVQPEPEFRPPMSEIIQDLLCMIPEELSETRKGTF